VLLWLPSQTRTQCTCRPYLMCVLQLVRKCESVTRVHLVAKIANKIAVAWRERHAAMMEQPVDLQPAPVTADRFERFEIIGRGSFGNVYRGCAPRPHPLYMHACMHNRLGDARNNACVVAGHEGAPYQSLCHCCEGGTTRCTGRLRSRSSTSKTCARPVLVHHLLRAVTGALVVLPYLHTHQRGCDSLGDASASFPTGVLCAIRCNTCVPVAARSSSASNADKRASSALHTIGTQSD